MTRTTLTIAAAIAAASFSTVATAGTEKECAVCGEIHVQGPTGNVYRTATTSPISGEAAYFEVRDVNGDTFVIALIDPHKITEARHIIATGSGEHVSGYVVPRKASYNPAWDFELNPDSIEFFKYSTEVCDATIAMVNDNIPTVGTDFLPGNQWCPWTSELVREVAAPK